LEKKTKEACLKSNFTHTKLLRTKMSAQVVIYEKPPSFFMNRMTKKVTSYKLQTQHHIWSITAIISLFICFKVKTNEGISRLPVISYVRSSKLLIHCHRNPQFTSDFCWANYHWVILVQNQTKAFCTFLVYPQ
jgi:hypothetical protein